MTEAAGTASFVVRALLEVSVPMWAELVAISVGSLLLLFGIWWSYFDQSPEDALRANPSLAFPFG